jgi:hypothetical protein
MFLGFLRRKRKRRLQRHRVAMRKRNRLIKLQETHPDKPIAN